MYKTKDKIVDFELTGRKAGSEVVGRIVTLCEAVDALCSFNKEIQL